MQASEIKPKRVIAGISGDVLCRAAGISRRRLSTIERGYVTPKTDELSRIGAELDRLIAAKTYVDEFAAKVGWPCVGAVSEIAA
jgi:transcriptional regulator with XRE-family HTH domain